jgi:hypothetical protein
MQAREILVNRFHLLRPAVILMVALSILTLTTRATAEDRPLVARSTAVLNLATGNFVAAGIGTHLGNYTEVGHVDISGDNPTALHVEGWAILTAANGDKLYASFTGQLNFLTGSITANLTYGGGASSGRFLNASGSSSLTAQFQPDGTLSVSVIGTLSY